MGAVKKIAGTYSESIMSIPEGKILDFLTRKLVNDTPEEYVRQNIEKALVRQYRYPAEDCEPEFSIKVGSSNKRVDIVVFEEGKPHTEPEESFEDKGVVYEQTDHIHIDLNSIPDHVRDDLARATLEAAKEFYSHPENKVEYQKWLAARKAKGVSK